MARSSPFLWSYSSTRLSSGRAGIELDVLLGLVSDDQVAQDLRRHDVQHLLDGDHNSCGAMHGTHALEVNPLVDHGEGSRIAVDLLADPLACVVGAAGSGVILAEGLYSDRKMGQRAGQSTRQTSFPPPLMETVPCEPHEHS